LQKNILHLDLRSANILLQYNETEKSLIPKISNFLWSKDLRDNKTLLKPEITVPHNEMIWKRWHDPDRLQNVKNFKSLGPSSDIYSLGLLFWEIAWCKPDNLPFKDIRIKHLFQHLQNDHHHEELPNIPQPYGRWKSLIDGMWKFKPADRYKLNYIEEITKKLFEGRIDSGIDDL